MCSDMNMSIYKYIIFFLTERFSLDNSTGILRIQSSLSNYTNESMIVKIFARDNGFPSLISSAQLKIYFANVLKSAPVFEKTFYDNVDKGGKGILSFLIQFLSAFNSKL